MERSVIRDSEWPRISLRFIRATQLRLVQFDGTRGSDTLPPDPLALIDRVRGAANETSGAAASAGEVDAGWREENASNQKTGARL